MVRVSLSRYLGENARRVRYERLSRVWWLSWRRVTSKETKAHSLGREGPEGPPLLAPFGDDYSSVLDRDPIRTKMPLARASRSEKTSMTLLQAAKSASLPTPDKIGDEADVEALSCATSSALQWCCGWCLSTLNLGCCCMHATAKVGMARVPGTIGGSAFSALGLHESRSPVQQWPDVQHRSEDQH